MTRGQLEQLHGRDRPIHHSYEGISGSLPSDYGDGMSAVEQGFQRRGSAYQYRERGGAFWRMLGGVSILCLFAMGVSMGNSRQVVRPDTPTQGESMLKVGHYACPCVYVYRGGQANLRVVLVKSLAHDSCVTRVGSISQCPTCS